ncbi:MAG: type II toxin-antitoxin system VapC family toxin [Bacteroidetes bacterium]|nr:type II toxin-antitoxin system VapC family toxin [Bacteroidota bacterium]
MLYLDTSVLVALYIPEPKSEKIQKFVSAKGKTALSSLTEVEFSSAVSRRTRMNEISYEDGLQVFSRFQVHVKSRLFEMYPIMQREYDLAREWIGKLETPLRTLDALHLAVAFSNQLILVTADVSFAAAARKLGISIEIM